MKQRCLSLLLAFFTCLHPVFAQEAQNAPLTSRLEIEELRLGHADQQFAFQSLLNIEPHPDLLQAMSHGIHVYVIADVQVRQAEALLWKSTLQRSKKMWKIKYNAIIKSWQIETDEGMLLNKSSLQDCFDLFQGGNLWFLPIDAALDPNTTYEMSVRFRLSASTEPNPLNFNIYSNDHWFTATSWKSTTFQLSKLDFVSR